MKKQTLQKRISASFIAVFGILLSLTIIAAVMISTYICRMQTSRLCRQLVSVNLDLLNGKILDIQKSQQNIAKTDKVKEVVRYYKEQE